MQTSEAIQAHAVHVPHLRVHRIRVVVSLAAVYLIWGSAYFAIRVALTGIPPFLMAGSRFTLAGAVLYAFLRARGAPAPTADQWKVTAGIGLLLVVAANGGVVVAEQWVDTGLTSIVLATSPLWTALFAGFWERWPSRPEWKGIGIGLAGVVLLNLHAGLQAHPIATAALVLASASWALGSIWGRHVGLPRGLMASATQMLTGGPIMLAIGFAHGEWLSSIPPANALIATLYLGVFSSLIGFSAYTYLIHNTRPALAVSYSYVNPVVAVALGAFFVGERISALELIAMGLTLASVFFLMEGRGPDRPHVGHAFHADN